MNVAFDWICQKLCSRLFLFFGSLVWSPVFCWILQLSSRSSWKKHKDKLFETNIRKLLWRNQWISLSVLLCGLMFTLMYFILLSKHCNSEQIATSMSKVKKITAIRKKWIENGIRLNFIGFINLLEICWSIIFYLMFFSSVLPLLSRFLTSCFKIKVWLVRNLKNIKNLLISLSCVDEFYF